MGAKCTVIWSENLEGRDNLEDLGINGNIIFQKWDREVGNGFIWLRIGTCGGIL
jgi:hypothetical protein